jgi:hypothetical protein
VIFSDHFENPVLYQGEAPEINMINEENVRPFSISLYSRTSNTIFDLFRAYSPLIVHPPAFKRIEVQAQQLY